eukprot:TRINITY_DN4466_c0_g1_i7.p2 TRINITY_DN4466_c0_g1~~TRINITY_DN4466_c0_g1_i7.p2  ORF type:complete len:161 (-),score=16.30 TRINITY_DN4466_c0_g1_i7:464-946(-)
MCIRDRYQRRVHGEQFLFIYCSSQLIQTHMGNSSSEDQSDKPLDLRGYQPQHNAYSNLYTNEALRPGREYYDPVFHDNFGAEYEIPKQEINVTQTETSKMKIEFAVFKDSLKLVPVQGQPNVYNVQFSFECSCNVLLTVFISVREQLVQDTDLTEKYHKY